MVEIRRESVPLGCSLKTDLVVLIYRVPHSGQEL